MESIRIRSCHKTANGRTVTIQSEAVHFLPAGFWGAEATECGDRRMFHEKEGLVICWDCALEQGVVNETEEQYDEKMERVLDSLSK